MREIKFRAWHEDWEVMVYSTSNHDWFEKREFYPIKMDVGFSSYPKDDGWVLMQYTGLKDKNGKEICEGDIVKSVSPLVRLSDGVKTGGKEANYYEIIWHEGKWTTRDIQNNQINGFAPYPVIWKRYYEVIGNIYENTELLNVKAEGKI